MSTIYLAHKEDEFPGTVISDTIEGLCGADVLITPLDIPVTTKKLLQKHLDSGAIMIQIKKGFDFVASIGPRINDSLATMSEYQAAPFQKVLLFTGDVGISAAGYATIDGEISNHLYITIIAVLDSWTMRGGTVMMLKSADFVLEYLVNKLHRVEEFIENPVKEVYPRPLQLLVKIEDWRSTIITFPLIGEVRAKKIRDFMIDNKLGDSLIQALAVMTDRKYSNKESISESVRMACRGWLGLPDGWNIDLTPEQ